MNSKVYQALVTFINCIKDTEQKWKTATPMMREQVDNFKKVHNVKDKPIEIETFMYFIAAVTTEPPKEDDDVYPTINFLESK